MRRKDREASREFALNVADKCEYATLGMANKDGAPYCVPVSIVRSGDCIYFHCAKEGRKIETLKENSAVCIACVGDTHRMEKIFSTEFESAIIFGKAAEVTDDAEKIEALRLLCERHTPLNMDAFDAAVKASLPRTGVWRVSIDEITGKRKKYGADGKEQKNN